LGITQERLAERADLHPNYLGRVERGEETVSLTSLRDIAKALHLRVRDLVVGI
jgi:transcriptional regulator with XRE-family HTH domain